MTEAEEYHEQKQREQQLQNAAPWSPRLLRTKVGDLDADAPRVVSSSLRRPRRKIAHAVEP
jgi:hypothetical protein